MRYFILPLLLLAASCDQANEPGNSATSAPTKAAARPAGPAGQPDKAVFGYYLGVPVYLFAEAPPHLGGKGPAEASPDVPDLTVYVTAPTSSNEAFHAPAHRIPTPKGERYLPPHEDTITRMVAEGERADAVGWFVVAAPGASADRVRVAKDDSVKNPADYMSGAPLAQAIKVGDQWLPLNNHAVIEYGLRSGLLKLNYFDYGGLMWAQFMDKGAEPIAEIRGSAWSPPRAS